MNLNEKEVVLVTGGSGLIGQALGKRLSQNYQVISLDINPPKQRIPGVTHISLNLASLQSIQKTSSEIKSRFGNRLASVIHLAAYYSFSEEQSPKYEEITVQGTEKLLQSIQDFQVDQFVFSSTMLVHTPSEPGLEIRESSPIEPKWAYPQSKVKAEEVLRRGHGSIPYVILRIAGVYTDRCQSIPIAHQIERIYERHLTGHFYPADVSRGQAFIHLDDLVDAIERVVQKRHELPPETTLLLGEDEPMSYGELQEQIGFLIHGKKWNTLKVPKIAAKVGAWIQERTPFVEDPFIKPWMIALADDHYDLDISQARKLLDWQPKHRLRNELSKMIQALRSDPQTWYRENKLHPPSRFEILARRHSRWILPAIGVAGLGALIWRSRESIRNSYSEIRRGKAA